MRLISNSLVDQKWKEENARSSYTGNAILLLDELVAHATVLSNFNLHLPHLSMIYLVPHSSHLTQPLDRVSFLIQKLIKIKKSVHTKLSNHSDQIRSMIKGIQQAIASDNIIAAFESADFFTITIKTTILHLIIACPNVSLKKFSKIL